MNTSSLHTRINAFNAWLWNKSSATSKTTAILRRILQLLYAIGRDLGDGQLSLRAMSLVYTTVIAFVPLLAIVFSVLKGFGMHNQVEPALLEALVDLGDKRHDIVSNVMSFINNVNVGVLGAVGFAILIYSVVSMMQKIEAAFNYIWQISRGRNVSERLRDYLSVIFVGPLLIFLSAAITTSFNTDGVGNYFEAIPFGTQLMSLLGDFFPYLLMSAGFALLYMFLPNTRVRFAWAFVGGLVTTVIWKAMGWGVSNFVANSASSMAIYSAFASIIILMTWMYLAWLVLLTGSSVTFYMQNPDRLQFRSDGDVETGQSREQLALSVLYLVGDAFVEGERQVDVAFLARKLGVAEIRVVKMVDELMSLGYLVVTNDDEQYLYPKKDLSSINVDELLLAIWSGISAPKHHSAMEAYNPVRELIANRADAFNTNRSLSELVTKTKSDAHDE